MEIKHGNVFTEFGPGVVVNLTGEEIATAISAYLTAHNVYINGARTIKVNGTLIKYGYIYVDPSGFVIDNNGVKLSGRGPYNKSLNLTGGKASPAG